MFFNSFSEAFLKAKLISSIETFRFTLKVISVKEPSGTGTRIPQPPIFPSNSGKILVIAFAAPVVVGIISCLLLCQYS